MKHLRSFLYTGHIAGHQRNCLSVFIGAALGDESLVMKQADQGTSDHDLQSIQTVAVERGRNLSLTFSSYSTRSLSQLTASPRYTATAAKTIQASDAPLQEFPRMSRILWLMRRGCPNRNRDRNNLGNIQLKKGPLRQWSNTFGSVVLLSDFPIVRVTD